MYAYFSGQRFNTRLVGVASSGSLGNKLQKRTKHSLQVVFFGSFSGKPPTHYMLIGVYEANSTQAVPVFRWENMRISTSHHTRHLGVSHDAQSGASFFTQFYLFGTGTTCTREGFVYVPVHP